jgi:hypothetical protein
MQVWRLKRWRALLIMRGSSKFVRCGIEGRGLTVDSTHLAFTLLDEMVQVLFPDAR